MEEALNNKLEVVMENGKKVNIEVLDIIYSPVYNKKFIIYTFLDDDERIYASILDEKDSYVSLNTITNPEEINYIDSEINRVAQEMNEE